MRPPPAAAGGVNPPPADAAAGPDAGPAVAGPAGGMANVNGAGAAPPAAAAAEEAAGNGARRRRRPRVGTGEWLRENRALPLHDTCDVTIVEACHWLATLKSSCRMTDEAIDKICLMVSKFLLPEGNHFPPSYHLVKATLGMDSSKSCTEHICDKCWSVFPHLSHADFSAHAHDTCTATGVLGTADGVCGNRRFNISDTGVITPKRCLYQFDVQETVTDLLEVSLSDLQEVKAQRAADFADQATFWGSPAGRSLDAACGQKFSNPAAGEVAMVFSLGVYVYMPTCVYAKCTSWSSAIYISGAICR